MHETISHLVPDALHFNSLQGTQLVLLLGIIMFFGALGGKLFQKLKIPQVVGYIVIGIIIGSSGFQILGKDTIAALNPISTVALSLIGFLIGGELKLKVLKKYGKQFIGILLFESITPFFIVGGLVTLVAWLFTKNITVSLSMGLILGAICSATAPAATTDVLVEYRTKGPLTTTIYGIVAMDDAVALVLYAISSTIASTLLGGTQLSFNAQLLTIARDIIGSIVTGSIFGFVLSMIIRHVLTDEGRILSFSLGTLFLCTGTCIILDLDNILAAMSLGFFMVNFAPSKTRSVFDLTTKFTPPVYVLFFVLVGAKLDIWLITPYLGLIALVYVLGRTLGKTIGSIAGARLTKAPVTVRKYLPYCLLSQAGVAIGLSIAAGNDFSKTIGPLILLIITATTFIVQLLGPICVKKGVTLAGECGLNITEADIKKNTSVKDVMFGNSYICCENSPAIVSDMTKISDIIELFSQQQNLNYIVKKDNQLVGIISLEHVKEVLQLGEFTEGFLAVDIMDKPEITCLPQTSLPEAYELFENYDTNAIPIVDENNKPMGVLEKHCIDHYLHSRIIELNRQLEKLG